MTKSNLHPVLNKTGNLARLSFTFALLIISLSSSLVVDQAHARPIILTSLQDWRDWVNGVGRHDPYPHKYGYVDFGLSANLNTHVGLGANSQNTGGVHAGSYMFVDGAPHPLVSDGQILITTVLGVDTNFTESPMTLGGFDASSPELIPVSVETITDSKGNVYESAPSQSVFLSELSAELPEHDLSLFSMSDPSDIVYLFRTIAPVGAIQDNVDLPGDFNADGYVNYTDLFVWKLNYGTQVSPYVDGDANGNGLVDGKDFLAWQTNFGIAAPALAATSVPEPATFGLLGIALVGWTSIRLRPPVRLAGI